MQKTVIKHPSGIGNENVKPVFLDIKGTKKVLIKINVAARDQIPVGLRQEMSVPPDYSALRIVETINSSLNPDKVEAQRPGLRDTGIDLGKVPYCEAGTLFFALLQAGFVIEDTHWKDAVESQSSRANNKGKKSYPIFINMVPKEFGKEERLDGKTFKGLVRLLYRRQVANLWDNRKVKNKENIVVNLTQPMEYDDNTPLKNKLVLNN